MGKIVTGKKETMLVLMPTEDGIVLETFFFHEEILELPKLATWHKVNRQELEMAGQLVKRIQDQIGALLVTAVAGASATSH